MPKFRVKKVRDGFGKVYYKIQVKEHWYSSWKFCDEKGNGRRPMVYYTYGREYETTILSEAEKELERFKMLAYCNYRG